MRGWNLGHQSLLFDFNDFTHELIDSQIYNILLVTWDCTMNQEVLKVPILALRFFGHDS
jgi:hypothetical protein